MKVERNQSRKGGRLAEERGYRMRDDASAKATTPRHVMKCRVNVIFFLELPTFQENKARGSKMALIWFDSQHINA